MVKKDKILFLILVYFSVFSLCINLNCKINSNYTCGNNTMCNESGICVCKDFFYGSDCDKKLSSQESININKGIKSESFLAVVLCISILSPFTLVLGFFLIFIFLKGRDGTYSN